MRRGPLVSAAVIAVLAVAAAGFTWEAMRPDHDELAVEVTATATPPIPGRVGRRAPAPRGGGLLDGARYDPETDTWRPMADAPAGTDRSHAQAVMVGGDVVIGGGFGPTGREETVVLRYDLDADRWRRVTSRASTAPQHHERCAGTAVPTPSTAPVCCCGAGRAAAPTTG
jgi:hypothetical protein